MKIADIKVGEDYAVGSDWTRRARVEAIEAKHCGEYAFRTKLTKVVRLVPLRNDGNVISITTRSGVTVWQDGTSNASREDGWWLYPRQVLKPWAEALADQERERLERLSEDAIEQDIRDRVDSLRHQLLALGAPNPSISRTIQIGYLPKGSMTIPLDTLEWLVDWAGKGQDLS
jgi:hypothetical protein